MSLTKVTLVDVVKKQYFYKLKAFSGVYTSLILVQLIALLFSFVSSIGSSSSSSSEGLTVSASFYSVDMVISFTMLWAFITAINVTTKAYRNDDFTFVTNRLSSDLSNIAFLFTVSCIGALTALLSSFPLKIALYFTTEQPIHYTSLLATPGILFAGIGATILYNIMFAALGYLIGTLIQLHSILKIVLPVAFFGMFFGWVILGYADIISSIATFYFQEDSICLFIQKVFVTVIAFFSCSVLIFRGVEVRK
ncbi:hypothetical protein [Sutcliffiella halmapala]|uniref:hypothetical protein n=1 Tax=Sutcliffiella halmapala TaxID=79882 RepID=UPI000995A269|nr:hypothetical protein [Sutcliffiella halmapala]